MTKEMRSVLDQIEEKTATLKGFVADNSTEEDAENAKKALNELKALQIKYDTLEELEKAEKSYVAGMNSGSQEIRQNSDVVKAFANDARNGFRAKSMTEGTNADGGYVVPDEIQTKIREYKEAKFSLKDLVRVEPVTTNHGARTYKKRSQQTGFAKVGEGGKITAANTPKFERIEFSIDKYAGYIPVTNELLSDSDTNLTETLITFIGDESRVTANKLIFEVVKTAKSGSEVQISSMDEIKEILNVKLGSAFKPTSIIVTNDSGLQWLDTLKDSNGNYLLAASASDPMNMVLAAGASTIPVKSLPNADLPNDETKGIPFIIGDLVEGIIFWDRQQLTITQSNVAQIGELNAFEEDLTIFRPTEREDVTTCDSDAFALGYVKVGE